MAIQGQAGYNYVDNVRGYSGTNACGRGGSLESLRLLPRTSQMVDILEARWKSGFKLPLRS